MAACWTKQTAAHWHHMQQRLGSQAVRRADFEQFGYSDNCPGCANARAGSKQAIDHSEQCRFHMEVNTRISRTGRAKEVQGASNGA